MLSADIRALGVLSEKDMPYFFQKRFLKFSDFFRNHDEIYFSGKCNIKLVIVKFIYRKMSKERQLLCDSALLLAHQNALC